MASEANLWGTEVGSSQNPLLHALLSSSEEAQEQDHEPANRRVEEELAGSSICRCNHMLPMISFDAMEFLWLFRLSILSPDLLRSSRVLN